MKETKLQFVNL